MSSNIAADVWARAIETAARQKGGAMLASALRYAASAQLDESSASLVLGFAPEQLLYRDSLERPANQACLEAVFQEVLGKQLKVRVERVAARSVAPIQPAPSPVTRHSSPVFKKTPERISEPEPPDGMVSDEYAEETEVEFDGIGDLPLPASPASEETAPIEAVASDEADAPPAARAAPPAPTQSPGKGDARAPQSRVPLAAADAKKYEEHPLVKSVLEAVGGMVISVTKK